MEEVSMMGINELVAFMTPSERSQMYEIGRVLVGFGLELYDLRNKERILALPTDVRIFIDESLEQIDMEQLAHAIREGRNQEE